MQEKYIELIHVEEGAIITEDVFVGTLNPIVRSGTILTHTHIDVLTTFLIQKIKIQDDQNTSNDKKTTDINEELLLMKSEVEDYDILYLYQEATEKMKREYSKWQAGMTPDITIMRQIIVPLLDYIEQHKVNYAFLANPDAKDYISHHSIAVGILTYAMARKLELAVGQAIQLGIAGTLIDSGMAKMPLAITQKAGRLTENELKEIKKHPIYSYQLIKDSPLIRSEMKLAILQHHERLDGTGYPRREKQDQLTIYSRILSVADTFHARISKRVYSDGEAIYKVLESFKGELNKYDIRAVTALKKLVGMFQINDIVELSNGMIGKVVFVRQEEPLRPIIILANDRKVDLTQRRDLFVMRMI